MNNTNNTNNTNNKSGNENNKMTLDLLYKSKIEEFSCNSNKQKVKDKIQQVEETLYIFNNKKFSDLSDSELEQKFKLEDTLKELKKEEREFENSNSMADYFMDTGKLLYEYYENIEYISKGDDQKRKCSINSYKSRSDPSKKTIIDFFHNKDEKKNCEEKKINNEKSLSEDIDDKKDKIYQSRYVLLDKYLNITDPTHTSDMSDAFSVEEYDSCPDCGRERIIIPNEACAICPNIECARIDTILMDANKPSYKDPPRDGGSYYSYKRINHFNEWLAQFQAKETTDIPEEVYDKIFIELKKERVKNMIKITPSKMKEILKRLKLNKYYEHIPHITNRINGQPAPVMSRATEEKLRNMFKEIQAPFIKHCPAERKNFLSYSYVLHKFCQLLGLDVFLPCFQLLKSREKLHQQDKIWEKICHELKWEFIKSV